MKDNKKYWDQVAGIYNLFMRKDESAYQKMYEWMRLRLNKKMKVLEIATGTGMIARNIAASVRFVEAVDFSDAMISKAKSIPHRSNICFSVQDACHLPYAKESFDAVIISNALHIMPNPEEALQGIRQVLKREGVLFAPTFLHQDGKWYGIKSKLMALSGFRVFHKWTFEEYCLFLNQNGFQTEKTELLKASFPLCYAEMRKSD